MTKPKAAAPKRWRTATCEYELRPHALAKGLEHLPPLVQGLLVSRGIEDAETAGKFLDPDYDSIHDPFLMKGMDKAVGRILAAVKNDERIAIWSDYDADGIPGGVVLHDLLKKIGFKNFENYIPHRHDEGFGLNTEGVDKLSVRGAKLIITVDCGVTDVAEVAHAKKLGMDVIITDHHLPGADGLPEAFAVIDPKQEGCEYPYKELCGSGVAFKLAQAVLKRGDFGVTDGWEKWLLDMVGLATLSDMVPLTGENRVFAFYGLKVLRKSPRLGLMKLARKLNVSLRDLTEDDIGFTITPRINAASRMGVPSEAFELLSTDDETEAERLSNYLNEINDERKAAVAVMAKEAKRHFAEHDELGAMKRVLVVGNPKWRPSLLGLVANSLVEAYKRPVFLWGREGGAAGLLKGSCRSDGSASVVDIMERANRGDGVFVDYGGHKMSGGFSFTVASAPFIEQRLVSAYEELKGDSDGISESAYVDAALSIDDVNWETYRSIERLMPFGLANPKPLFVFEGVVVANVRTFGKGDLHTELKFENSAGRSVNAIAFFTRPDDFSNPVAAGSKISLAAHLERSAFRGTTELRLRIVDILS